MSESDPVTLDLVSNLERSDLEAGFMHESKPGVTTDRTKRFLTVKERTVAKRPTISYPSH